ncbi:BamA/OMP85 family outer membrane protein [Roseimaritima ulvae]|uniref:BamA/OMP85 family outer membrane protein n=1 Tax=Roseimaritima ulvae TaxID=980254 RepID=UPI001EE49AA3|nr:BamA/TamA family outer membrane protein [Roseimaritima ulvae]
MRHATHESSVKSLPPALAALFVSTSFLIGSLGCTRMPSSNFAPPPFTSSQSMRPTSASSAAVASSPASTAPTAAAPQASVAASRVSTGSAATTGNVWPGSSNTVVRGQGGGGFSLPPTFQVGADAGRHSRTPLPVSGQPDTRVAQGQSSGTLPAPAQLNAPTTSPGYSSAQPPATTGAIPPSFQNAPAGPPIQVVPSGPGFTDGTVFGDPAYAGTTFPQAPPYMPRDNVADLVINGAPGRTGRIMLGGAVNSDAGITGQLTIDERNFDIRRWPTSFQDLFSGTAFRGDGQSFRIEAAPGSTYQRYSVQFGEPNLFDTNVSMNLSGFLYDRAFQDWDESRIGGRVALGYRLTPDLSASLGLTGQSVELSNPRVPGTPEIDDYLGSHNLFTGQFKFIHDTRNSPFAASQGHLLEWSFEQAFGDFNFPKAELDYRRYFLVRQRADGSGKHTLTLGTQFGVSGSDTPVFENFFAGGYATLRGFEFRGASPTVNTAQVGGRFSWISSVEYMAPLTADDAFKAVAFVDFGTVERDFHIKEENFRVAPGFGFRVAIPAMGPAPLAFDFAFPVAYAETDERQVFSFYMSAAR